MSNWLKRENAKHSETPEARMRRKFPHLSDEITQLKVWYGEGYVPFGVGG